MGEPSGGWGGAAAYACGVTVYLVGAGPGDPGLLTVRGAELLARADIVVYDRLSVASLLELARPGAELISVGKAPGHATMPQDEIAELLVARGRAGQQVVRLKGGDPFVFARGGEEAAALLAAGVDFEVVPGVTSAVAVPAYAGIPLTLRHSSTHFTVVTGHEDPSKAGDDDAEVDWEAVAALGGTIVVLMGVGRLRQIADRLIAGGLDPATPAAAVRWGTRPEQRTVRATLATLADQHLESPSTIVIGRVADLNLGVVRVPAAVRSPGGGHPGPLAGGPDGGRTPRRPGPSPWRLPSSPSPIPTTEEPPCAGPSPTCRTSTGWS